MLLSRTSRRSGDEHLVATGGCGVDQFRRWRRNRTGSLESYRAGAAVLPRRNGDRKLPLYRTERDTKSLQTNVWGDDCSMNRCSRVEYRKANVPRLRC